MEIPPLLLQSSDKPSSCFSFDLSVFLKTIEPKCSKINLRSFIFSVQCIPSKHKKEGLEGKIRSLLPPSAKVSKSSIPTV